ncbi:PIG-L family deacetylase, partial [Eubacteriales bacterium OttesenSCG-928-N13]|nr:PIG-L family deacetylase [Eubacteriales bacterium OttesenSCG-928-N13]
YKEALTGLWTVGLRNYPTFVGFKDGNAKNITQASRLWKTDTTRKKLVELIRQFKPEVIVTTDIKGENKLGTNMLLAQMMQESVVQAADDTKFADSATKSGTWQTKKLYLHLYNENQISMDYTTALDTLGGVSPSSVAREGYGAHATLLKKTKYEEGGQYDNSKFGLAFTTVGDDVMKNDMFENITESAADWDPTLSLAGNNTDDLDDLPDNLDDPFADDLEDLNIDETGLEPLTEDELNQMSNTLDGVANEPTPAPPIEQAAPGDGPNVPLISLLVGVPVVLGGGAYGYTAYRKYDKKRRRAKRRAERQQKHDM